MNNDDVEKLYSLLDIKLKKESDLPTLYDTVTPYKLCTAYVDTPTTFSSSTVFVKE